MNRVMQMLFNETTTKEAIERNPRALQYDKQYEDALNKLIGTAVDTEKEDILSSLSINAQMVGFEAGFNMALELLLNR